LSECETLGDERKSFHATSSDKKFNINLK
jgi:hypothetical protein